MSFSRLLAFGGTSILSPPCRFPGAIMSEPHQDSEPPMVVASRWVHQITSIAFEMALPAGAGALLDHRWGTSPWLVVLGACFGFVIAGMSLAQMVKQLNRSAKPRGSSAQAKTTDNSGPSSQ